MTCASENKIITIIQGQTSNVTVKLIDANTKQPFSLAGLTGATGIFPTGDGTEGLAVTGTLVSADLGELMFSLDETTTEALTTGEQQSIQVQVDQGAVRSIAQLKQVLTVNAPLFTF